jgi:hypothetical protein
MVAVPGNGSHDRTRPNPRRTIHLGNIPSDFDPLRHESSSPLGHGGGRSSTPRREKASADDESGDSRRRREATEKTGLATWSGVRSSAWHRWSEAAALVLD